VISVAPRRRVYFCRRHREALLATTVVTVSKRVAAVVARTSMRWGEGVTEGRPASRGRHDAQQVVMFLPPLPTPTPTPTTVAGAPLYKFSSRKRGLATLPPSPVASTLLDADREERAVQ